MSRGFVKEEDQEEVPFVPPRAYLAPGVNNYVTPHGYHLLLKEKEELQKEFQQVRRDNENDKDRRIQKTLIQAKLDLLQERINTAKVISIEQKEEDRIRFGATVKMEDLSDRQKIIQYQIVGVDEADIKNAKLSFTAPLAKALIGKACGEEIEWIMGPTKKTLRITEIKYL